MSDAPSRRPAVVAAAVAGLMSLAFVPPAPFAVERAGAWAARRAGVRAIYESDGRRIALEFRGGGASFEAGLPPDVGAVVRALFGARPAAALRLLGGDPSQSSWTLWQGSPALAVGSAGPRDRGPRVFLHPETFAPLGASGRGLSVRFLEVAGLLTDYGLPTEVQVEVEGLGLWTARLAAPPTRSE